MQGSNFIQQAGMGATQATLVVTGVVETGGAAVDAVAGRLAGAARTTESVGSAAEGAAGRAASVSDSVPATGPGRPSAAQQAAVNEIGNQTGCHTCGATNPGTKSGNWVADHQPPSALNPSGGKQVLKPQCLQCSRQQGGQVAAAVKKVKRVPQSQ